MINLQSVQLMIDNIKLTCILRVEQMTLLLTNSSPSQKCGDVNNRTSWAYRLQKGAQTVPRK